VIATAKGRALHGVGVALTELGELAEAENRLREALLIRREVSDQPGESRTRFRLANVRRDQGRHAEAEADYEASLATLRAVGDRYHEGLVLWQMGVAAQQQGAEVMAQARWQQAMTILEAMGCSEIEQVRRLIAGGSAGSDPPAVRVEPCV
jgi:tetratricopeptide (TPR) repeat protein